MARRSSARLRNQNSSTPKRVSLSHDAPTRTPRTAPVKLVSVQEDEEMPGAFPRSASGSPATSLTPTRASKRGTKVPVKFDDDATTPKNTTPIKPTEEEMHPKQHQQSTAKPLDEARWLGFAGMGPHTEPTKQSSKAANLQGTPTRGGKAITGIASPKFNFSFQRQQSLELSPEAKKLMSEKREEAAKIREQMIANGEGPGDVALALGRKIATPKSAKDRFSGVHKEWFNKMDSIANHPSVHRATPNSNPAPGFGTKDTKQQNVPSPTKSLKRSPSKAQLDEPEQGNPRGLAKSPSKSALPQPTGHVQHTASSSKKTGSQPQSGDEPSPTKRVKRSAGEDVSIARPSSSGGGKPQPATPQPKKVSELQPLYPDLSTLASPTEASLARAASVKSAKSRKIPAPSLARSPSKPALESAAKDSPKASTPLLARSPSKATLFSQTHQSNVEKPQSGMFSPLLKRSAQKSSNLKKTDDGHEKEQTKSQEPPLLSRSPLKMSVAPGAEPEAGHEKPSSSAPLLSRSPAKITMPKEQADQKPSQTPNKSSNNLMGRFNLLRSSPMKSILRSPQRLYSDDPAKVAAGTHLATPPKLLTDKRKNGSAAGGTGTPAEKHVDFTSSTKDRDERAQSEMSSTSSNGPTPPSKAEAETKSPKTATVQYPELPTEEVVPVVTPQKRRQTAAPGDFTFRAGQHAITFGQSPNAPRSAASEKRPSTIRHVSADPGFPPAPVIAPGTTSKKRKFEYENGKAADSEMAGAQSDKENAEETEPERPAKRVKQSGPEPSPTKPATRRPTLGVKPKKGEQGAKEKKPSTISKARLNALAQPKRRG